MSHGVISVENTALSSQVLFEDFVGFSNEIVKRYHLKTNQHLSLNKDVGRYFSDYEKEHNKRYDHKRTQYFFVTLTLNQKLLRETTDADAILLNNDYTKRDRRDEEKEKLLNDTFRYLLFRMNKKLGIKKPARPSSQVIQSYSVVEKVNKYGTKTLDHIHAILCFHPSHYDKVDRSFFETAIHSSSPMMSSGEHHLTSDLIDTFHISKVEVPQGQSKWMNLFSVIDYCNKGWTLKTDEQQTYSLYPKQKKRPTNETKARPNRLSFGYDIPVRGTPKPNLAGIQV